MRAQREQVPARAWLRALTAAIWTILVLVPEGRVLGQYLRDSETLPTPEARKLGVPPKVVMLFHTKDNRNDWLGPAMLDAMYHKTDHLKVLRHPTYLEVLETVRTWRLRPDQDPGAADIARYTGSSRIMVGEYREDDAGLTIDVRLLDRNRRRLRTMTVKVGRNAFFQEMNKLIDALVDMPEVVLTAEQRRLLSAWPTKSFDAFKAYGQALSKGMPTILDYDVDFTIGREMDKVIALDGQFSWAYVWRSYAELNYMKAVATVGKALQLDGELAEGYLTRGLRHAGAHKLPEAVADYTKAIELAPWCRRAYCFRAEVERHRKNFQEAMKDYDRAIVIEPWWGTPWSGRALLHFEMEKYEEAARDAAEATRRSPHLHDTVILYGRASMALKNYAGAIKTFKDLDLICKMHPEVYYYLGRCYLDTKDYPAAIAQLTKAAEKVRDPILFLHGRQLRGEAYLMSGEHEKAIAESTWVLDKSKPTEPWIPEALWVRAQAYHAQGRNKEAWSDIAEYKSKNGRIDRQRQHIIDKVEAAVTGKPAPPGPVEIPDKKAPSLSGRPIFRRIPLPEAPRLQNPIGPQEYQVALCKGDIVCVVHDSKTFGTYTIDFRTGQTTKLPRDLPYTGPPPTLLASGDYCVISLKEELLIKAGRATRHVKPPALPAEGLRCAAILGSTAILTDGGGMVCGLDLKLGKAEILLSAQRANRIADLERAGNAIAVLYADKKRNCLWLSTADGSRTEVWRYNLGDGSARRVHSHAAQDAAYAGIALSAMQPLDEDRLADPSGNILDLAGGRLIPGRRASIGEDLASSLHRTARREALTQGVVSSSAESSRLKLLDLPGGRELVVFSPDRARFWHFHPEGQSDFVSPGGPRSPRRGSAQ